MNGAFRQESEKGVPHARRALFPFRFAGATFDSRQVKPGMLYVALKGERTDGHAFVEQALAAGAAGALVRANWPCSAAVAMASSRL